MVDGATRVLVVDDNREICAFLQAWINDAPDMVCVGTVYDGRTALQQIVELEPDVVILDVILPQIDGLAVLEEMRKQRLKSRCVILTAFGAEDFMAKALELGADSCGSSLRPFPFAAAHPGGCPGRGHGSRPAGEERPSLAAAGSCGRTHRPPADRVGRAGTLQGLPISKGWDFQ